MNQVNVIGKIGQEPEVRFFDSGKKVMRFSIAINGYGKGGSKRRATWSLARPGTSSRALPQVC